MKHTPSSTQVILARRSDLIILKDALHAVDKLDFKCRNIPQVGIAQRQMRW